MDTPSKIEDNIGAVKNDDSLAPPLEKLPDTINNNQTASITSIDVNMAEDDDEDDDDDDDEYYYSKRLKIVEEDVDEKGSQNNEQSSSSVPSIKKSPSKKEKEEDEEIIESEKIELSKTPSPLPPLTYTYNEQQINDNQSIDSESPTTDLTDNDQSSCQKVPPLKIICSKGDFSLVIDENQKSNDSETTVNTPTTTISSEPSTTNVDSEEKNLMMTNETETIIKKETTVILRKTTASSDNTVTYELPTTRSTRNQQQQSIQTNKRSLRDTMLSSPASSNNNKSIPTTRSTLIASPISESMKLSTTAASNTMIRRKLRSHTRQQQGSGAPLSPSNTTSNSSADYVEVNLDDSEENKKETDTSVVETQQNIDEIVATSRKRKVRQQQQQQISENSNDGNNNNQVTGKELNSTMSTSSNSSATSQSIATTGGANPQLNNSAIQQLPLHRVFLNTNNCFKQFIEIRTEIVKRRELFKKNTIEQKLPKNYDEFCLVKKSYLIKGNKEAFFSIPFCPIPSQITEEMKELYTKQEKDRFNLQIRQRVEQDKILIMYEHEVLRSFNQTCKDRKSTQLSFCTIIKDDEIYSLNHLNSSNPANEQSNIDEESTKDVLNGLKQNLNDLEQKFQKLKDDLIKRQLHESDSLHAVQLMDWQSKLKKVNNNKINLNLHSDTVYVPIVIVNSKFELTPIRTC